MNIAVIFAGGVGSRMRSKDIPKQFLRVHNKPIIIHTLELFEKNESVDGIVVSCLDNWIGHLTSLVHQYNITKVLKIVPGGDTGQESIYNGLKAANDVSKKKDDIVIIHDGVRPLITDKTISDNISGVKRNGSAITCVKAKETILIVNNNESIKEVPDRNVCRLARAPQSFYLREILLAHKKANAERKNDFIDSCSMMQYYGKKLFLIEGPQENIKITTPDDFYTMRALLDARENEQIYPMGD